MVAGLVAADQVLLIGDMNWCVLKYRYIILHSLHINVKWISNTRNLDGTIVFTLTSMVHFTFAYSQHN